MQLEDVLSWQCGHPQVRSMQSSAGKDATEAAGGGDLQLDVLSNLERHVDRLSAFSDEEDEAELHNLYMVSMQRTSVFTCALQLTCERQQGTAAQDGSFTGKPFCASCNQEQEPEQRCGAICGPPCGVPVVVAFLHWQWPRRLSAGAAASSNTAL